MNLKIISGSVAPAVCVAFAVAMSQQAGAVEKPLLTPEQQKQAEQINNDLINKNNGKSDSLLTGDTRLACEALMCLMAEPKHRQERYCKKSIAKYYSIKHSKPHKTINARRNFLKQCPTDNDSETNNRIEQIVHQNIQDCSAATLNKVYYHRANADNNLGGDWATSSIKLVPALVANRCGANWQAYLEYKCDEKQVVVWEEDYKGYSKMTNRTQTVKTNCRFMDRN